MLKHIFSTILLIGGYFLLPAQDFSNWTIWTPGGIMEIDSACTISLECNDQDPLSRDYCNGEWCTHTFPTQHFAGFYDDMEVDANGTIWIMLKGGNIATMAPMVARFDGTEWFSYHLRNSAMGKPNPDPFPLPYKPFKFVDMSIADDGVIHCFTDKQTMFRFDGQTWERDLLSGLNMSSITLDLFDIGPGGKFWITGHDPVELAVWDSSTWTIYTPTNSNLPDAKINTLEFDESGNVWLATDGEGVVQFDGQNWTQYTKAGSGIGNDQVYDLDVFNSQVGIITFQGFVDLFDGTNWTNTNPGNPLYGVELAYDKTGNLWLSLTDGFGKYDGTQWTKYFADSVGMTNSASYNVETDSSGLVWFSSSFSNGGRIGQFDGNQYSESEPFPVGTLGISETLAGEVIWNTNDIVWRYTNGELNPHPLSGTNADNYTFLVEDANGNWWTASSLFKAVWRFDGTDSTEWNSQNSNFPNSNIRDLFLSQDGTVWAATSNGGVGYFDGTDWVMYNTLNSGISSSKMMGIAQDTNGVMVFVNSYGSIDFFDGQTWSSVYPSVPVVNASRGQFAIEDTSDFWYILWGGGLFHYQQGAITTWKPSNSNIPSDQLTGVVKRDNGELWIGNPTAYGGITTFDGANFDQINRDISPLPYGIIRAIYEDQAGNVWLAGDDFLARVGDNEGVARYPISGTSFYDPNNNGIQDVGELGIPYLQASLQPLGVSFFTDAQGHFEVFAPEGNHTLALSPVSQYLPSTGTLNYAITLDSLNPGSSGNNFGLVPSGSAAELESILGVGIVRCDRNNSIWMTIRNIGGTTATNAEARLVLDPQYFFLGATVLPTSQTGDTLFWQLGDLMPLEQQQIVVTVLPSGVIGDTLLATVETKADGGVISDNPEDSVASAFRCSFDPNDKMGLPGGSGEAREILMDQTLTYTIRFQNTGNDTAFLVTLVDTLDSHFSVESLQILQASHDFEVFFLDDQTLKFVFEDILLPDSTTNPLYSQGFVQYRVSPLGSVIPGTKVYNRAAIFFDANLPIITNTTEHTYVETITGIRVPQFLSDIEVFPNPAQDFMSINLVNPAMLPAQLLVIDMYGRKIEELTLTKAQTIWKRENLPSGIYLLQLKESTGKAVKVLWE